MNLTLVPVAQGVGISNLVNFTPGVVTGPIDPPISMGDLADSSDTTLTRIGAWYEEAIAASHLQPVYCDFVVDPAENVPIAMAFQLRASTPAATRASPPSGGRYLWTVYSKVNDGTILGFQSYNISNTFQPLTQCTLSTLTTMATYWGDEIDPDDPTDNGNWCELAAGGGEMLGAYEALTGAGLRVTFFIEHYNTGGQPAPTATIPWVDIAEARLVTAAAVPVLPPPAALAPHHGSRMFKYTAAAPDALHPNQISLLGPSSPNQGNSAKHVGRFAVDPHSETVSGQVQVCVQQDTTVWMWPYLDYYLLDGETLVPQGSDPAMAPFLLTPLSYQWTQVNVFTKARSGASHWTLRLAMSKSDPRNPDTLPGDLRLDEGTEVYYDCCYVPDNGLDLASLTQPYLDGDQPEGTWEGDVRNSTSIYGAKPPNVFDQMIVLDYDLLMPQPPE